MEHKSLSPEAAISPNSFHLTIGLLTLSNSKSIDNAKQLLQSLKSTLYSINRNNSLQIRIDGLDVFPEKAFNKAQVLYAKAQPETGSEKNLFTFIDQVRNKFQAAGILQDQDSELKLHATLFKVSDESKLFDATSILSKLGTATIGTYDLNRVQICKIGSCSPRGSYEATHEIDLC